MLVIVPDENLKKATKNIIQGIEILDPALDENGNPVDVRLNYQFEDI
ncbi:MAG: hypothetical protein R3214_06505 [Christiangramia sp.]|nr:hypothetical protein [Christiangramia sp.]